MRINRLILLSLVLLSAFAASAQDLIVKQDGETIRAYRTDVGNNAVYYRLEDNDKAPILTISKSDVLIVKLQDGTKIDMDGTATKTTNGTTEYVPKFPAEPVADPELIAKAEIGSLIEFFDGTKGIVFYLDGNGHGLAVYLYTSQRLLHWQAAPSWHDCIDIEAIPNECKAEIQMGLGAAYCDAAIKQVGLKELPAINWCRNLGPDWYLPSLGELYQLIVVANQSKASSGPISKALIKADGNRILGDTYYLSSSEDDDTNIYTVHASKGVVVKKKYTQHNFRAIRMF